MLPLGLGIEPELPPVGADMLPPAGLDIEPELPPAGADMLSPGLDMEPELPPAGADMLLPGLDREPELPSVEDGLGLSLEQRASEGDFLHSALSALGDRDFFVVVVVLDCAKT
jgi:hypothetical protein